MADRHVAGVPVRRGADFGVRVRNGGIGSPGTHIGRDDSVRGQGDARERASRDRVNGDRLRSRYRARTPAHDRWVTQWSAARASIGRIVCGPANSS